MADDDVPSGVDFRVEAAVHTWVAEADVKRPYRAGVRAVIAEHVAGHGARRILELGGGPGLLAEAILAARAAGAALDYTLLDFSAPMLALAKARVPGATLLQRDFLAAGWPDGLGTFDAVVTMQAVHELRHKRRAPRLYTQVYGLLAPEGLFVVCDHEPSETRVRARDLHATAAEQHGFLAAAGFRDVTTLDTVEALYVIAAGR